MKRRSFLAARPYSRRRTSSKASPRWRMTWNLSKTTRALGAWRSRELRNAGHMSMTESLKDRQRWSPMSSKKRSMSSSARPSSRLIPGTLLIEIGHHDRVAVTFADRNLIDSDGPQPQGGPMLGPEVSHVADVHAPDLAPVEPVELGDLFDRHGPALPADKAFEAVGEAPRLRQPGQ